MGIERDEFQTAVAQIREDIRGVHSRLDMLNGRTRSNENNIVRIQERMKKTSHWPKIGVFSGVAAVLAEVGKWYFTK